MKNCFESVGIKAPDTGALNKALKVKQYINATKSKNRISLLQKIFTNEAALNSMVQMVYKEQKYAAWKKIKHMYPTKVV